MLPLYHADWSWAVSEPKIAGFNPYHWDNEYCTLDTAACLKLFEAHSDGQLGAESFPETMAQLRFMGQMIIDPTDNQNRTVKERY
jgi:hypothetical protein